METKALPPLLPEILYQVFSESSLSCFDLLKIRRVSLEWRQIIEDETLGRLRFRNIGRVLKQNERWTDTFKRWATTTHWIVVDTSGSMIAQPSEVTNPEIVEFDETGEIPITPWMRAIAKAEELFRFLKPITQGTINLCFFSGKATYRRVKNLKQFNRELSKVVFGTTTKLEAAIQRIFKLHAAENPEGKMRSPIELFVLSDFIDIYNDAHHEAIQTFAFHTQLKINCFNFGYFQKPDDLIRFEEVPEINSYFCVDYDVERDGRKREREILPEDRMELDGVEEGDGEPPLKRRKIDES